MSKDTDLAQIFKSGEFHSVGLTFGPATYYGHWLQPFDDEHDVTGLGARWTGLRSDLSLIVEGSLVTVESTVYKVMAIEPGGGDAKLMTLILGDQT